MRRAWTDPWLALACALACGVGCSQVVTPDAGPLEDASLEDASPAFDVRLDVQTATCGAPGATPDGDPCVCDTDCVTGAVCFVEGESGFPFGLCARRCASGPCSPGTTCWEREEICTQPCGAARECGPGRSCSFLDEHCRAYCRSDADCLEAPCDRYTGICQVEVSSRLGVLEPCTSEQDCRSGRCRGYCITECELGAEEACPEGTRCLAAPNGLGFCAPPCVAGTCPAHLRCRGTARDGTPLCSAPPPT